MRSILPCAACRRQFSTSAYLAVQRPQAPYDLPKVRHDAWGKPIRQPDHVDEKAQDDPKWRKRVEESERDTDVFRELALMAEPPRKGFYEQYGSHDGYGLRNKARYRVNDEGKLETWQGAGGDWRKALGLHRPMFKPGQRVEVPGFKHRESLKMDRLRASRTLRVGRATSPTTPAIAPPFKTGSTNLERSLPPHLSIGGPGVRRYSTVPDRIPDHRRQLDEDSRTPRVSAQESGIDCKRRSIG